jgi:hypothetical protein
VTTLKKFEEALREKGLEAALTILEELRDADRSKRSISRVRRISGRKMTSDLAHQILHLHRTTDMTQQEIAFHLGVNQGRVSEVINRGKWLESNPHCPDSVLTDIAPDPAMRNAGERPRLGSQSPDQYPSRQQVIPRQLAFNPFHSPDGLVARHHSSSGRFRSGSGQDVEEWDTRRPLDLAAIRNAAILKS